MRDPRTLEIARKAVVDAGNIGDVARLLGYNRSTLSRYLNEPDYPSPVPLEKAILARFDRRICQATGADIARDACRSRAALPKPYGNPVAGAHWESCQACQHKEES